MNDKQTFKSWFQKFEGLIEVAYEDYKQDSIGKPPLTYKQFAFGLYLESKYADSLVLN